MRARLGGLAFGVGMKKPARSGLSSELGVGLTPYGNPRRASVPSLMLSKGLGRARGQAI